MVCHDFQNGREVTLPSERLLQKCIVSRILMLLKTCTYECTFVHTYMLLEVQEVVRNELPEDNMNISPKNKCAISSY